MMCLVINGMELMHGMLRTGGLKVKVEDHSYLEGEVRNDDIAHFCLRRGGKSVQK